MNEAAEFQQFLHERDKDLRQIARLSRGEHSLSDAQNEAWLLAHELSSKHNRAVAFLDSEFQAFLLRCLHQEMNRYTDLRIRYAASLDHAPDWDETSDLHEMVHDADGTEGLLDGLINGEADERAERFLHADDSLASAYLVLLRRCKNDLQKLADYLHISRSHCSACISRATELARHQRALPVRVYNRWGEVVLGPWRRFRAEAGTEMQGSQDRQISMVLEPRSSSSRTAGSDS